MKRYIFIFLFCTIIGTSAGIFSQTVNAQTDGSGWAIFGQDLAQYAKEIVKWVKDELYKTLRDAVVKRVVDDLTDQIIDSIENGGSPLFVQDPIGELQRVGDLSFDTFNAYLNSEAGLDLCAPFQAELSLYFQTTFKKEPRFGIEPRCRFDEFKQNLQDSAHLIEKGGWNQFQQVFNLDNNFFGASLLLDQAYLTEMSKNTEAKKQEISTSKGFLNSSKCIKWQAPDVPGSSGEMDQYMANAEAETWCTKLVNDGVASDVDSCKERYLEANCIKKEVLTPGSVVAEAATKGVLKDFEYASNVQSVISALVNSILSKVLGSAAKETSGLLKGGKSSTIGSDLDYSSYSGTTFADKIDAVERNLRKLDRSYYDAEQTLKWVKEIITRIRRQSIQAIYNCYYDRYGYARDNTDAKPIGPPDYGILVYYPQQGFEVTAKLGDLIEYPMNDSILNEVSDVVPEYANRGKFPPPTSSTEDYPAHSGYVNDVNRIVIDASADIPDRRKEISDALDSISIYIPMSERSTTSPSFMATSTLLANKFLTKANDAFSDFVDKYQKVLGDMLTSNTVNLGPGTLSISGGSSSYLNAVSRALMFADYDGVNPGGTDVTKTGYFYCGESHGDRF